MSIGGLEEFDEDAAGQDFGPPAALAAPAPLGPDPVLSDELAVPDMAAPAAPSPDIAAPSIPPPLTSKAMPFGQQVVERAVLSPAQVANVDEQRKLADAEAKNVQAAGKLAGETAQLKSDAAE